VAVFWARFTGEYAIPFWSMAFLCFVIPFFILASSERVRFLERQWLRLPFWWDVAGSYLIIIPTLTEPRLPYARAPMFLHGGMVDDGRVCAGFVLALILFSKFFPIISIWEMEKEEKERKEEPQRKRSNPLHPLCQKGKILSPLVSFPCRKQASGLEDFTIDTKTLTIEERRKCTN